MDRFELEKSKGQADSWVRIATVPAANNPGEKIYSFIDDNLSDGVTYFRLKMVGYSANEVSYSLIRTLRSDTEKGNYLLYPNPAGASAIISWSNKRLKPQSVKVFDTQGKLFSIPVIFENTRLSLNIGSLPAGVYTVELKTKSGVSYFKLLNKL